LLTLHRYYESNGAALQISKGHLQKYANTNVLGKDNYMWFMHVSIKLTPKVTVFLVLTTPLLHAVEHGYGIRNLAVNCGAILPSCFTDS